ncbi:hypothetical protein Tco_1392759 [Tanacetum coccineum]
MECRPSSGSVPLFKDVSGDAIHAGFFPFSIGPYYATYLEGGVAGNCEFTREEWDAPYRPTFRVLTKEVFKDPAICKTVVDQFPTPGEMVWVESLSDDQLTVKISVLYCMMMSHGGELLARYRDLLQSRHEQVASLNDKLSTSDAAFAKFKSKGKERKKKIKSLSKSLDQLNAEVARLSTALNQAIVLEAEKDEEILRLKATPLEFASFFRGQFDSLVQKFLASDEFSRVQSELLSLVVSAGSERGLSMHRTKDEFAAMLKKMAYFVPGAQGRLSEASPLVAQTDYAFLNKISELAGTSYVLDDVVEVAVVRSGRVSSSLTDVVVALSAGEKGDGSLPSSIADEEATSNPSGV